MASTYTTSLNLELQASGENSGTWGTKTNTNISLLETAICGGASSSLAITATTQSLTASDGSADQSRRAVLKLTGTLTGNTTLSSEAVEKIYWIDNQTTMSTYTLTFKPAGGTGVSLADGRKHLIFQDGSTAFDPLADYGPINSSALTVENSTTATPVVTIKNTTNDATGGSLRFVMDKGAAGADADVSGTISFYADDSAQNNQEFAKIVGTAIDATTTSEEGGLDFYVAEVDGTVTKGMAIAGHTSGDGDVTVDVSTHDGSSGGLKLGGTLVTSTATELNLLDGVSGLVQGDFTKLAAVDSTYGELNLLDGSAKSTSSITIGDTDAFIVIDGTTTKQIPASDISTYVGGVSLSSANVWTGKQSVDLAASNITPAADGSHFHVEGSEIITDTNTSGSGTAAQYSQVSIEAVTLAATNASVTTTKAATFYIKAAPTAGTNQTLTNAYALWVDAGKVQFDADLSVGTSVTVGTDANVGNDLNLTSSGAIIDFNSDVTLTHASQKLILDGGALDLDGEELILDPGGTTSITADTNNQIDIKINNADDFQFTANTFTIPSGSTVAIAAGGAITNAGSMAPDITSTGKALVFGF